MQENKHLGSLIQRIILWFHSSNKTKLLISGGIPQRCDIPIGKEPYSVGMITGKGRMVTGKNRGESNNYNFFRWPDQHGGTYYWSAQVLYSLRGTQPPILWSATSRLQQTTTGINIGTGLYRSGDSEYRSATLLSVGHTYLLVGIMYHTCRGTFRSLTCWSAIFVDRPYQFIGWGYLWFDFWYGCWSDIPS